MTASAPKSSRVSLEAWQNRVRAGFFIFYAIAGVMHLAYPGPFLMITPQWVPHASLVIALTGLCEIAGTRPLAFSAPKTRRFCARDIRRLCLSRERETCHRQLEDRRSDDLVVDISFAYRSSLHWYGVRCLPEE